MSEKEVKHYVNTIVYSLEQTLTCLNLQMTQAFNELNLDITLDQGTILDTIYCRGKLCQRDLSKLILKDRSNTNRMLNVLEKKGYIKRIAGTKDNRLVNYIELTEKGKETLEYNMDRVYGCYVKMLESTTEEDLQSLRLLLDKLMENLHKSIRLQV